MIAISTARRLFLRRPFPPTYIRNMSSAQHKFHQAPHSLLVIPGPIEISDDVLLANAHPSMSHVSPDFIPVFGDCIRMTRQVFLTESAQPFLIGGSGTLGWDQVAANLVEPGEEVLVLHSGYFGDSFADCLQTYGATATQLKAQIGRSVPLGQVEKALKEKKYKIVTVTHVDTSTGVLSDIKSIAEIVRRVSPETLVVVDGVCSVASEELRFDQWGLDVVLTGSQKGLGTPPGLSIVVASQRALKVLESRKTPVTSYYANWNRWIPIMKAYESHKPSYFATPPVNLMYAYHASLSAITNGGIEERIAAHREASRRVKDAARSCGLKQLPLSDGEAANGMSAFYYPTGLSASDIIPRFSKRDIVVAGGLHVEIKDQYFRIGHMGITVVEKDRGEIDRVIDALKEVIQEAQEQKA